RVQRHDGTGNSGGAVEDPVYHQRCGRIKPVRRWSKIIRIQPPGDLEFAEVFTVDLIQRRVPRARQVGSVGGPLTIGFRRGRSRPARVADGEAQGSVTGTD